MALDSAVETETRLPNLSQREKELVEAADSLNSYLLMRAQSAIAGSQKRVEDSGDEVFGQREKKRLEALLESYRVVALRDACGNLAQYMLSRDINYAPYDAMDNSPNKGNSRGFEPFEQQQIALIAFGRASKTLMEKANNLAGTLKRPEREVTEEVRNSVFGFQLALGIKNPAGKPNDKLLPILDKVLPMPTAQPPSTGVESKAA